MSWFAPPRARNVANFAFGTPRGMGGRVLGYFVGIGLALTLDQLPVLPAVEASVTHRIHLRGADLGIGARARLAYDQTAWSSQDLFGGCTGTSGSADGSDRLGALDLGVAAELQSPSSRTLVQLWVGGHVASGLVTISYSDMDSRPQCRPLPPTTRRFVLRAAPAAGLLVAHDVSSPQRRDRSRVSLFLHLQGSTTLDEIYIPSSYVALTAGVAIRR